MRYNGQYGMEYFVQNGPDSSLKEFGFVHFKELLFLFELFGHLIRRSLSSPSDTLESNSAFGLGHFRILTFYG